jgi:hypothetical protein
MSISDKLFSCVSCCVEGQPQQQQNPVQPEAPIQEAQQVIKLGPIAPISDEVLQARIYNDGHRPLGAPDQIPIVYKKSDNLLPYTPRASIQREPQAIRRFALNEARFEPSHLLDPLDPIIKQERWPNSGPEKRDDQGPRVGPLPAPSVKKSNGVAPAIAEIYDKLDPDPLSHVLQLDKEEFPKQVEELREFLFDTVLPAFEQNEKLKEQRGQLVDQRDKTVDPEEVEKLTKRIDAFESPIFESDREVKLLKASAKELGTQLFESLTKTIPANFEMPNQGGKQGLFDGEVAQVSPYPPTYYDFSELNPGIPAEVVKYRLELTKNQIINCNNYCRELDQFILKNKASLLKEFSGIEDPAVVERMEYTVKKLSDEPHLGGGFAGLVTFHDPLESTPSCCSRKALIPKPVVIKPRSGACERHIMELFQKLNDLPENQRSYKQKLETFKVVDYPTKGTHKFSAHEFVAGNTLKAFEATSVTQHLDLLLQAKSPSYPKALESALHLEQVSKEALASDLHGENVLFHLYKYIGIDWEVMTNTAIPPFEKTFIFNRNRRDENDNPIPDSENFYINQVQPLHPAEKALIQEANKELFNMELRAVPVATAILQEWIHEPDIKEKVEEYLCRKLINEGWDLIVNSDIIVNLMQRVAEQGDIAFFCCMGEVLYIKVFEDGKINENGRIKYIPIAKINKGVN